MTDCSYTAEPTIIHLNCILPPQDMPGWEFGLLIAGCAIAGAILALLLLRGFLFKVEQTDRALVERWGKYKRTAGPGLHLKWPIAERIAERLYMPLSILEILSDAKTRDDVFVQIKLTIQYQPTPGQELTAHYSVADEDDQIKALVFDSTRAQIPLMDLDEVFSHQNAIATAAKNNAAPVMAALGWSIVNVLVTDIIPDANVKAAMNEIQKQVRLQEAATAEAERKKIIMVKEAEAKSETRRLEGEGVAKEQKAITQGLKERIETLAEGTGVDREEVTRLLILTQYFDMLREVGANSGSKVLFMPTGVGAVSQLESQLRDAVIVANQASKET